MALNPFGHVDLRVNSRETARAFYSELLPELGFTEFDRGANFDTFSAAGDPPLVACPSYAKASEGVPSEPPNGKQGGERKVVGSREPASISQEK